MVAVTGARGGVGATTLAVALAAQLGAVLVDTDGAAGGVDLWLGGEQEPGVRWSGLGLAGGTLAAADLVAALPVVGGLRVLAADRAGLPAPEALDQALAVLEGHPVVVDLARGGAPCAPETARRSRLVVVVVPAAAAGVASAHVAVGALQGFAAGVVVGLVLVGRGLTAASVAAAVGVPVLAAVDSVRELDRAAAGLADAVLAAFGPVAPAGPANGRAPG